MKVHLCSNLGWNQIQFNLSDFTRRAYGSNYIETLRVTIHANCRIRRIYFSDRLYSEEELPPEFKLFLPIQKQQWFEGFVSVLFFVWLILHLDSSGKCFIFLSRLIFIIWLIIWFQYIWRVSKFLFDIIQKFLCISNFEEWGFAWGLVPKTLKSLPKLLPGNSNKSQNNSKKKM